jgi:hypothetical protein
VEIEELDQIATELGEPLTMEELESTMGALDPTRCGSAEFVDFVRYVGGWVILGMNR